MVRVHTVRTVKSTSEDYVSYLGSPASKIPNRFRSKYYDRSVFGGEDCVKAFQSCSCNQCSMCPMIVISAGEKVCDKYNITLRTVKEFVDGGLLESLHEESYLIYAQKTASGKYQVGILAALDVEDCKNEIVKKHELCVPQSEAMKSLRTKHFQSLYVDPIMVMYRNNEVINDLVTRVMASESPISLDLDADGATAAGHEPEHLLWCVQDKHDMDTLRTAFESVDSLYIADGHHRTAAACSRSAASRAQAPPSARYITALIFAHDQLNVLSYNRCLRTLGSHSKESFEEALARSFEVAPCAPAATAPAAPAATAAAGADESAHIRMFLDAQWFELTPREHVRAAYLDNPLGEVHAQVLVEQILEPIFNLFYPDGEKEVLYVDGRSGLGGVEQCVLSGQAAVGFALRRVQTAQIMRVADAGRILPPKATFFDPKPMAGLLLRLQR